MINLVIPASSEASSQFIVRLNDVWREGMGRSDALLVEDRGATKVYEGEHGLLELRITDQPEFDLDVLSVNPGKSIAERLVRSSSAHNTFLVTERCDQLCVMCSQPPKKTHIDRWSQFTEAARLAPRNTVLGISGGEPTLYKAELLAMIEQLAGERPDLSWHVLSNGQHFDDEDIPQLASSAFAKVTWGVPIYAADDALHDQIVGKVGAGRLLRDGLAVLLLSGSRVELRTVVMSNNLAHLPDLGRHVGLHLGFCEQWSLMQLEAIGFAQARFQELYAPTAENFGPIAEAIDAAELYGVQTALFNFPRCQVPVTFRKHAVASISDWKRKYGGACESCREKALCGGFFAWHPENAMEVKPL